MSEFENSTEPFEEDFDDLELQAIFASSLASVTGRYDGTASTSHNHVGDVDPF